MTTVIILFIVLNFCHFLADYTPLSTKEMLAAKRFGKPIAPIFIHALTHTALMGVAILIFTNYGTQHSISGGIVLLIQAISHTVIDILKGRFAKWIPITADNTQKWYWMVMGFDQLSHQTIIALMIYILLKY